MANMKTGTYQSRRRNRKIERFLWIFELKARNLFINIVSLIVGLIYRVTDKLFGKQLRIVKRGEIYEGIKN